jgi:hypothetical protein
VGHQRQTNKTQQTTFAFHKFKTPTWQLTRNHGASLFSFRIPRDSLTLPTALDARKIMIPQRNVHTTGNNATLSVVNNASKHHHPAAPRLMISWWSTENSRWHKSHFARRRHRVDSADNGTTDSSTTYNYLEGGVWLHFCLFENVAFQPDSCGVFYCERRVERCHLLEIHQTTPCFNAYHAA